jgi:hypothetical protein
MTSSSEFILIEPVEFELRILFCVFDKDIDEIQRSTVCDYLCINSKSKVGKLYAKNAEFTGLDINGIKLAVPTYDLINVFANQKIHSQITCLDLMSADFNCKEWGVTTVLCLYGTDRNETETSKLYSKYTEKFNGVYVCDDEHKALAFMLDVSSNLYKREVVCVDLADFRAVLSYGGRIDIARGIVGDESIVGAAVDQAFCQLPDGTLASDSYMLIVKGGISISLQGWSAAGEQLESLIEEDSLVVAGVLIDKKFGFNDGRREIILIRVSIRSSR